MNKEYFKEIEKLLKEVPEDILDISATRTRGKAPTQAFSEFVSNREQGDWAEDLLFRAINDSDLSIMAVKYGKSDKVIAGDPGFTEFYEKYQDELDTTGKRPDILIFQKQDYIYSDLDISNMDDDKKYQEIVPKAIAGFEVRSSSFLIEGYNKYVSGNKAVILSEIKELLNELTPYVGELNERWQKWLTNLDYENYETFRDVPRISSTIPNQAKEILTNLKSKLNRLNKRDYLSFTPKVEDILVIYKWIQNYGVPHFYVQVFFDKVYAISFKRILEIISNAENKGKIFTIEKNSKNQFKSTIHISINEGLILSEEIDFPEISSEIKKLGRGRLLFHTSFNGGKCHLDFNKLNELLNTGE